MRTGTGRRSTVVKYNHLIIKILRKNAYPESDRHNSISAYLSGTYISRHEPSCHSVVPGADRQSIRQQGLQRYPKPSHANQGSRSSPARFPGTFEVLELLFADYCLLNIWEHFEIYKFGTIIFLSKGRALTCSVFCNAALKTVSNADV